MHIRNLNATINHEGENVSITFEIPATEFVRFVDQLKKTPNTKIKIAATVKDIPTRKQQFYSLVKQYQCTTANKYPAALYKKFTSYWVEVSPDGKKLRFESQSFFDIGRRLATFWEKVPKVEKDEMWNMEKSNSQKTLL